MTGSERTFVRGNDHLGHLLADPDITAEVAQAHKTAEEMDHAYVMNRAMIRKGANVPGEGIPRKLGVGHCGVEAL